MRRRIQTGLLSGILALWIALGLLIIRQRHLLDVADPMRDTGISFGYTFLTEIAPVGMVILTAIAAVALIVLRPPRKQDDHAAQQP